MVEFELHQGPHRTSYATGSGFHDPATRLGLKIAGLKGVVFPESDGVQIVKKAITLVDEPLGRGDCRNTQPNATNCKAGTSSLIHMN